MGRVTIPNEPWHLAVGMAVYRCLATKFLQEMFSPPEKRKTLDDIREEMLVDAKAIVGEGVSVEDEVAVMETAFALINDFFDNITFKNE